jgi:hypothetical protein
VLLKLEQDRVVEGRVVGLDLVFVDTSPRGNPQLELPDGLTASFTGRSTERRADDFQFVTFTTYSFSVSASQVGDYTIGPVQLHTTDGDLTAPAVTLHVEAAAPGTLDTVTADLGRTVAYVGQVLVYHLHFETDKALVQGGGRWRASDAEGFTQETSAEYVTDEYVREQDGKSLSVQDLYYPLRATTAGRQTIPSAAFLAQYQVRNNRMRRPGDFRDGIGVFADLRSETYTSRPLTMEVRGVPPADPPEAGPPLVGSFTVSAQADTTSVAVGQTVTVEVTVQGDGVLAGYKLPSLDSSTFRVYDDQPKVEARIVDGKYAATATFKRAIVPQTAGALEVPPVTVRWFDPTTERWETGSTQPIAIQVNGEAKAADVIPYNTGDGPKGVDALAEDILPVRTEASVSAPVSAAWSWLLLLPGAGLLLGEAARVLASRQRVAPVRRMGFDDLPTEPEARQAAIERIFREAVAARVGVTADALRREDLGSLGASAVEAERLYREIERRRYGGGGELPLDEVRRFVEGLR